MCTPVCNFNVTAGSFFSPKRGERLHHLPLPPSFIPWLTLFHSSGEHRPRSIRGAAVALTVYSHVARPRNKERDEETKRAKRPSACAADGLVTAAALRLWERWARECARPGWRNLGRNLLVKAPKCLPKISILVIFNWYSVDFASPSILLIMTIRFHRIISHYHKLIFLSKILRFVMLSITEITVINDNRDST